MPPPVDLADARILEIGFQSFIKQAFPEQTQLLWGNSKQGLPLDFYTPFSLTSAWHAWRDLRRGKYDLIVVWVDPYPPWNFRRLKAMIGKPFRPLRSLIRIFAVQWLRLVRTDIPLVVVDLEDQRTIARHNLFLFSKAKYFFKRELPTDRWQAFQHTAHPGIPGARFRGNPKHRRWVEKLRPISLAALSSSAPTQPDFEFPEKTTDIFVAISSHAGTTVRTAGLQQLQSLARQGIQVDIPETRLDQAAFFERMSRAWLTWSPEGLGWECFRHYEAPLVGSVPVINTPTIVRYHPLIEGEHAFYYRPDEPENLRETIVSALADKDRLRRMALAARAEVLAHHILPRPLADAIVRMGLGLEDAPGGVVLDP